MTISRCILSCVLAGLSLALVAPPLWLIALSLFSDAFHGNVDFGDIAGVFVAVAPFAALIGVAFAVVVGTPILLALQRYGKHFVLLSAFIGAVLAPLTFFALGLPLAVGAVAVVLFASILGAYVGGLAAWLARPNNSFKPNLLRSTKHMAD